MSVHVVVQQSLIGKNKHLNMTQIESGVQLLQRSTVFNLKVIQNGVAVNLNPENPAAFQV